MDNHLSAAYSMFTLVWISCVAKLWRNTEVRPERHRNTAARPRSQLGTP